MPVRRRGENPGSEFQVNTTSNSDPMYARIAADEQGNFTAVWQSSNQDGDGLDIYGQQFDSSGTKVGTTEFRVNTTTAGDQHNANIGMNAAGDFVVSWTSDGVDGEGQGIFAQRYNADGSPALTGSATGIGEFQVAGASDNTYTIAGAGIDIGYTSDQGHFASEEVDGNVTIIARIDSMTNPAWNAKAGIMLRESTNADSAYAFVFATPEQGLGFQWRGSTGAWAVSAPFVVGDAPMWLKLTRTGNDFNAYYSANGETWIQIGSPQTIVMDSTIQAGLTVSSLNVDALCTANFSNLTINGNTDLALSDADLGSPALTGSFSCNS